MCSDESSPLGGDYDPYATEDAYAALNGFHGFDSPDEVDADASA